MQSALRKNQRFLILGVLGLTAGLLAASAHGAPEADLLITTESAAAAPGEVVTYRVMVRNNRPHDLADARLVFQVPNFLVPFDATPQAEGDPATRTIEWGRQTIAAGSAETFTLQARVEAHAPPGTVLRAQAVLSADDIQRQAQKETTITPSGAAAAVAMGATTGPAPFALVGLGIAALTGLIGLRSLV